MFLAPPPVLGAECLEHFTQVPIPVGCGVWGVGFGVWGVGCGVWGGGCRVWGVGYRATLRSHQNGFSLAECLEHFTQVPTPSRHDVFRDGHQNFASQTPERRLPSVPTYSMNHFDF